MARDQSTPLYVRSAKRYDLVQGAHSTSRNGTLRAGRWATIRKFSGNPDGVYLAHKHGDVTKRHLWKLESDGQLVFDTQSSTAPEVLDDIAAVMRQGVSATEKQALVQARLGQGRFRAAVLAQWGGKCAVTGISLSQLLRASHIKPWRGSNNMERLDSNNGLPLVATLDAMFDCGLISFQDSGGMLVSSKVPASLATLLHLKSARLSAAPTPRMREYLAFHRQNIFSAA